IDDGAPGVETGVLVPVGIVDQRIQVRPGAALAGKRPLRPGVRGVDRREGGGEVRVGLDDAERPVEIRRVLVPVLIFAPETSLAFLPVALPLLPVGLPAPAAQAGE